MNTFDQALFDLFERGLISYEEALKNAAFKLPLKTKIVKINE